MEDDSINLKQIWHTLVKRRYLIAIIFFCSIAIGVIANQLISPTYESEVLLRVSAPKSVVDSLLNSVGINLNTPKYSINTYVEMLKSPQLLRKTIVANNIMSDGQLETEQQFAKRITAQNVRNTELLSIRVTAPSASEAGKWTNSLAEIFLAQAQKLDKEERERNTDISRAELNRILLATELEFLQVQIKNGESRNGFVASPPLPLTIYNKLIRELKADDLVKLNERHNVNLVSAAVEPSAPIRPRKALNLAIAACLGLFLGLGAVFFLEYRSKS